MKQSSPDDPSEGIVERLVRRVWAEPAAGPQGVAVEALRWSLAQKTLADVRSLLWGLTASTTQEQKALAAVEAVTEALLTERAARRRLEGRDEDREANPWNAVGVVRDRAPPDDAFVADLDALDREALRAEVIRLRRRRWLDEAAALLASPERREDLERREPEQRDAFVALTLTHQRRSLADCYDERDLLERRMVDLVARVDEGTRTLRQVAELAGRAADRGLFPGRKPARRSR